MEIYRKDSFAKIHFICGFTSSEMESIKINSSVAKVKFVGIPNIDQQGQKSEFLQTSL